jgi:hypothetical protein
MTLSSEYSRKQGDHILDALGPIVIALDVHQIRVVSVEDDVLRCVRCIARPVHGRDCSLVSTNPRTGMNESKEGASGDKEKDAEGAYHFQSSGLPSR